MLRLGVCQISHAVEFFEIRCACILGKPPYLPAASTVTAFLAYFGENISVNGLYSGYFYRI
jgi:hypothetical protein